MPEIPFVKGPSSSLQMIGALEQTREAKFQEEQRVRVSRLLAAMTLEQKLGQLIMVEYIGSSYEASGLQQMITQQLVGGYLYQPINQNFDAPNNTSSNATAFSARSQADARTPLLIAVDQEGGLVNKLGDFFGEALSARAMAATGNPNVALTQGAEAAHHMRTLGINVDLAPVVDIESVAPGQVPLLRDRTFGRDPQTVTTYAGAYLDGLQKNGVMGTLKHFPGLGSLLASQDPHNALYTLPRDLNELRASDFLPYKQLIAQKNPALIMTTDILVPSADPNFPAELSPTIVTSILRQELGYQGVVITDGLYMHGITAQWSIAQAAVQAIIAGNDIIEGPYTPQQVDDVLAALKYALGQRQLSMARVDEAVQRILAIKVHYGLIK
jgi:beta-N-acetylhexosaminidase